MSEDRKRYTPGPLDDGRGRRIASGKARNPAETGAAKYLQSYGDRGFAGGRSTPVIGAKGERRMGGGPRPPRPRGSAARRRRDGGPGGRLYGTRPRGYWARVWLTISIVALVLVCGISAWALTRPASVSLTAMPKDATIAFAEATPTVGAFALEEIEPGRYRVVVSRSGYATSTVTLQIGRAQRIEKVFSLKALPWEVAITSKPTGAAVKATAASGKVYTGTTPCTLLMPAGRVSVALTKSGRNDFQRAFFLEKPERIDTLLDPKGQVVHALGIWKCAGAPKGVAITPDGKQAWTAILNGPPSVQALDARTGTHAGDLDLGKSGAVEVVFNRSGTKAYASQMETRIGQTSKIYEIDVKTMKVLRLLDTKSTMTKVVALSPDENTCYAANWAGNDISVIDLKTGRLRKRIAVAKTPRGLWPTKDGKFLWVAGFDKGDLERIELASGKIKKVFRSGGAMRHLVADEKRGKLYASDMGKDTVWVADMKTLEVTKFCKTDAKPNTIDLSPDGRVLFISNRGENNPKSYYIPGPEWGSILLYDTTTGKPLDAIIGGNQCTALDVSDDGTLLMFSDFLDDTLRAYEVPSYEELVAGNGGRYQAHLKEIRKKQ